MKRATDTEEVRLRMFRKCMQMLCTAWGKTANEDLMTAYWFVLGEFDAKRIEEGFRGAMKSERFMGALPNPATIRSYIQPIAEDFYPVLK